MKATKRYLYIMCYDHNKGVSANEFMPSFAHTYVRTAEGESAAYALGGVWADRELKAFKGHYINDYIVDLDGE